MNDASRNVPRPVAWAALAALTLILAGCGVHYDFVIHDNETADLTYIMWDSSDLHLITKETCTEKDLGKSSPLPEGVEATYTYTSHNSNPACQVTAKAVPLSKLQTDTWTIKHKDGQYIFDLSPGSLSKLGSKNQWHRPPHHRGGCDLPSASPARPADESGFPIRRGPAGCRGCRRDPVRRLHQRAVPVTSSLRPAADAGADPGLSRCRSSSRLLPVRRPGSGCRRLSTPGHGIRGTLSRPRLRADALPGRNRPLGLPAAPGPTLRPRRTDKAGYHHIATQTAAEGPGNG